MMQELEVKTQAFIKLINNIQKSVQNNDVSMMDEDHEDEESNEDEVDQSDDVEMTEENQENSDAEMSQEPQLPNPLIQEDKQTIEELLKSSDDIEVTFYYKGKPVDKNTSFYEICKDP